MPPEKENGAEHFKPTQWTNVLNAAAVDGPRAEEALARLCEDYRPPLFRFACHWLGTVENADDLTQGFFCHFIAKNLPGSVAPRQGSFRKFLIASFKNYLRDEWRKSQRQKEIPREAKVSIDAGNNADDPFEIPFTPDMEQTLDRLWAENIRRRVIQKIDQDFRKRRKEDLFLNIGCLLEGESPAKRYGDIAESLGLSEGIVKVEVVRMREKFALLFRSEVLETVGGAREAEEEYRYLFPLLFSPGAAG